MRILRSLLVLAAPFVLTACIGKIQVAVERNLQPAALLTGATLTETVRFRMEPPPGASPTVDSSAFSSLPTTGWTVTDESRGEITEMRATRTVSGDKLFAISDDPGMGRYAVRVTDLFVARRYEVKIAVSGTGAAASRPTDAIGGALEAMLLDAISYEQVLVMPGFVTSHDFPKAEGSRLSWRVDLREPNGRVLRAESWYVDPAASAMTLIGAVALMGGVVFATRRRMTTGTSPAAPLA